MVRAVLTGRSTVSGFDLAWFSSLSLSASVFSVFMVLYVFNIFVTFFRPILPFGERSMVMLTLDVVD